ncbi:MAG: hypothetical protein P8129_25490 [Anaerolineae bacterium]
MNLKRVLIAALLLALVAAVVAVPGIQIASGPVERLTNGDFESGFYATPLGYVGNGWGWFTNDGEATYGFYDETWTPVVYDGDHGQLIEINTYSRATSDADRYAGVFQTVAVVPGETYDLSFYGMLRALADDADRSGYNYRLQYGIDYDGGSDWSTVADWVEVPWDTVHPRLSPGDIDSFSTSVEATGPRLTLFVRAWKKWGTVGRELDVNLDAISLVGAMPAEGNGGDGGPSVSLSVPDFPVAGWAQSVQVQSSNGVGVTKLELFDDGDLVGAVEFDVGLLSLNRTFAWTPRMVNTHTLKAVATDAEGQTASAQATVTVGLLGQFLVNSGFEEGFVSGPLGEVGIGWGRFTNDGQSTYGFYDETWPPVVYDGDHGQLIEINTYGRASADPDRYAGIYQVVGGLTPGATYKLSLHGMLRALIDDPDLSGYNYRIEWGYDPDGGQDWSLVDNWVEIPLNTVHPRLVPGDMDAYSAEFEAPAAEITLFFRAWKKWGTTARELDVNFDAITLMGYASPIAAP